MSEILDFLTGFIPALETLLGYGTGYFILIMIGVLLGVLLLNAAFLRLALYIKKVPTSFATCMGSAFYMLLAGFANIIPVVGIFIAVFLELYIIKTRHFLDWVNTFIVWIIAVLLPYGLILLILVLTGVIAVII